MKTIVVIEDNFEMRENVCEILTLADYQVYDAPNGKIGIQLIEKTQPDLIVCDIMMPELDGYGVLKILSKKETTKHIPFIFLTAKAEKSDFRTGMNLGADDYLTKPFTDLELLEAIEIRLLKTEVFSKNFESNGAGLNRFLSATKDFSKLNLLIKESPMRCYKKGEKIYKKGQYPRELFLVEKGQLKAVMTNDDGKDFISNIYNSGDFIGYQALLENSTYGEDIEALTEVEIYTLPKIDFLHLMHADNQICQSFVKLLANNIREKEQKLLQLAYESVRKRVADALVSLSLKNDSLSLQMKRNDIASFAGTAKETVIRTLGDFKDEGLIDVSRDGIQIRNLNGLIHLKG